MNFTQYPKYKDSGIEWIGKIPEEWEVKKTKYVAEDKKFAIVDGPFGTQLKAEEYLDEGVPLIRINNLSYEGKLDDKDIVYISETKAKELRRSAIKKQDIVIGKTGATIGKSGLNDKLNRAIIASSCLKISPKQKQIYPKYLNYFMISYNFQDSVLLTAGGSTRDTINISPFSNLFVLMPNLTEQIQICDYLDQKTAKIDELIKKNETLIELLKEKRKAIISQAVTKGLDPNAKMHVPVPEQGKDSGIEWIGEIPEGWETKKLKYVSEIVLGKMLQNEDSGGDHLKPYMRAQNIQWETIDISDIKEMWLSKYEMRKYKLEKGNLLVSEGGEVGRTALWNNEVEECYIQNSVHKVTANSDLINNKYLLYLFETCGNKGFFESIINRVSIGHLTREKLKEIEIIRPPINNQNQIVAYLTKKTSQIDELIGKKEAQNIQLKEYRQTLISNVVTGKVKVK